MPSYNAPVEDMMFLYEKMRNNKNYNELEKYKEVTSDLVKRVWQHKSKLIGSFTKQYKVGDLVYYEQYEDSVNAIQREKRLKKWNRSWKNQLPG